MLIHRNQPLNPVLLERARAMRHEPAPAEKKLWQCLRDRQLNGFKFRRQHAVSPFIADFFCHEVNLVIELDGESHGDRQLYDASRTKHLERDGYHVVRFSNDDVFWHLDSVLEEILRACEHYSSGRPHPDPLPEGEGEILLPPPGEGRGEGLESGRNHP